MAQRRRASGSNCASANAPAGRAHPVLGAEPATTSRQQQAEKVLLARLAGPRPQLALHPVTWTTVSLLPVSERWTTPDHMPGRQPCFSEYRLSQLTYAELQFTFSCKLGTVYFPLVRQRGGYEHRLCCQVPRFKGTH